MIRNRCHAAFVGLLSVFAADTCHAEAITLVAEDDWYPYSASFDGTPKGFTVDLVRAAYKKMGVDVSYETMPYARCMKLVSDGERLGCFDTVIDAELSKTQQFHKTPMFQARIVIYAPASHPDATLNLADLYGKRVGIVNGYTYTDAFLESKDKLVIDQANKDVQNLLKLAKGRIDYALVYESVAEYLIGANKTELEGKVRLVGEIGSIPLHTSFAKNADGTKYLELLDQGLQALHASGEYDVLWQEWQRKLAAGG